MFSNLARTTVRSLLAVALVGGAYAVVPAAPAAADVSGDWMAAFTLGPAGSTDLQAVASDTGDMAVVWVHDGAVQLRHRVAGGDWSRRYVVAGAGASSPRAAFDASGRLLVVWASTGSGHPELMARVRDVGGGWAEPVRLAQRTSGTLAPVDLAVNASGQAVVGWLWNHRALASRGSLDAGTWSASPAWTKTLAIDVAIGDGGHAAVMLQRWVGPLADDVTLTFAVARQSPAGVWAGTRVLQTVQQSPPWVGPGGIAVDAQGVTTLAWQRVRPEGTAVVAMRAQPGHAFGTAQVVAGQPLRSEAPVRVFATAQGDVLLAWLHQGNAEVRSARLPSGGEWSAPVVVCDGRGIVIDWDVAFADSGQALAAASRAPHFDWGYGTTTSVTRPSGRWTLPTPVTDVTGSPQVALGAHDAVVAWIGPHGVRARAAEG